MLSNNITDLITATENLPRSASRNRLISHLNDALAHAKVIESVQPDPVVPHRVEEALIKSCICPLGAVDGTCPIHGW